MTLDQDDRENGRRQRQRGGLLNLRLRGRGGTEMAAEP